MICGRASLRAFGAGQPSPPSMASESATTSGRGRMARKWPKMVGLLALWPHETPSAFLPAQRRPASPPLTRRTSFCHSGHHWRLSLILTYLILQTAFSTVFSVTDSLKSRGFSSDCTSFLHLQTIFRCFFRGTVPGIRRHKGTLS